ncbi:MAG: hypothetical protein DMF56_05810 [Acidobacteria bacterium]|nr:MAG: hypothetical protein DMF56_05810 [Acidobacteriota bacterium]
MITARFVIMTLLVFVAGAWSRRYRATFVEWFAAGLATLTIEMIVLSAIGVRWSIPLLLIVPVIVALIPRNAPHDASKYHLLFLIVACVALAVYALTVMSAAATSGDFVFFWGTKGQIFGQERMLDTAFLRNPDHVVMHPEYPPLVPLYYAWTMLGAQQLDWFGAMASAILFLALATLAIRGDANKALFAAMFALLFIRNDVAGNAEPALIFFEVVACGAAAASAAGVLASGDATTRRPRAAAAPQDDVVTAIALCGAILTKMEGAVFAILFIVFLWRRKLAIIPLVVLAAWLVFAKTNGLFGTSDPRYAFSVAYVWPAMKQLAGQLSFGLWYLPWIACGAAAALGRRNEQLHPSRHVFIRRPRAAAAPLLVAAIVFLAFMVLTYARPEAHLEWSAQRVLMTPLVLFFFSAITRSA